MRGLPAIALAMLCIAGACNQQDAKASVPPVPVVDLPALQKYLEHERGTPLLVNLWATWCGPCCEEMPDLVAGTREFRARGGAVVGVAMEMWVRGTVEQGQAKVQAAVQRLGIDFPVLVYSEDDAKALRKALHEGIGVLPQTLAIDRGGKVVEFHEGSLNREEFAELARKAER